MVITELFSPRSDSLRYKNRERFCEFQRANDTLQVLNKNRKTKIKISISDLPTKTKLERLKHNTSQWMDVSVPIYIYILYMHKIAN
jgi:hypothetical protein